MTEMMRFTAFALCTGLAMMACDGQRCLEREEIAIEDATGLAEDGTMETLGVWMDQFFADTETTCLPLRKIVLTTDLTAGWPYDDDFEPIGRYRYGRDRIEIEVTQALAPWTLRHELCHALDDVEGHSSADGNPFERVGDETVDGYPESLQEGEIFARACEDGPFTPRALALMEAWDADPGPRIAYLRDEVFTGVTPEVVELDLLDRVDLVAEEAPLPGHERVHAASPGRLDVVVQSDDAIELVRFTLDPLTERSRHPLGPADLNAQPFLWPDGDDVWVGWGDSATRWGDDGPTGETLTVEPGPHGARSLSGGAPVLGGRVLSRDTTYGDALVIDLATGQSGPAGLPGWFQRGWTADGVWVLASDYQLLRGTPESGWWAETLSWDRPIPVGELRLGVADLWFGEPATVPVATDADGVNHFADVRMEAGWDQWRTGESWRLIGFRTDRVVVTTVHP